MDEKALKTSWTQRIVILIIAILLLGSTIAAYMFIVLGGGSPSSTANNDELIAELTAKYDAKNAELEEASKPLSDRYFDSVKKYQSQIKSYNSASANSAGLVTKDLANGSGKTLAEGDTDYLAYYIGWCPDGSIFDSSFNDNENPTSLKTPLDPSMGLIEGWNQGVIGMKLGGVRELSIPGELAYGDTQEICGAKSSPLKFVVMPIEKDEKLDALNAELNDIYMQLYYAYYGSQI